MDPRVRVWHRWRGIHQLGSHVCRRQAPLRRGGHEPSAPSPTSPAVAPSVSRRLRGVQHLPTSAGVSTVKWLGYAAGLDSGTPSCGLTIPPSRWRPSREGNRLPVWPSPPTEAPRDGGQAGTSMSASRPCHTPSRPRLVGGPDRSPGRHPRTSTSRNNSIAGAGPDGSAIVFRATGTGLGCSLGCPHPAGCSRCAGHRTARLTAAVGMKATVFVDCRPVGRGRPGSVDGWGTTHDGAAVVRTPRG